MKKISYPIDETLSDVVNKKCPILHVIKIIDSKWKLPILWYLHEKENPPKEVEYSLTEDGLTLMPAMNELYDWGSKHMQKIFLRRIKVQNRNLAA